MFTNLTVCAIKTETETLVKGHTLEMTPRKQWEILQEFIDEHPKYLQETNHSQTWGGVIFLMLFTLPFFCKSLDMGSRK